MRLQRLSLAFSALIFLASCMPLEETFKSTVPVSDPATSDVNATDAPIPKAVNLPMAFYPQAPDGDWNLPWQEACEEASSILAVYAMMDQPLDIDTFRSEILSLVDWQNDRFGDYLHTSMDQTAEMIRDYLDYESVDILNDPTAQDLKEVLARGELIIAPFAGQMLNNPFYSGEGPPYHVLVIRGYDPENFITNDVGTRRGENFVYPQEVVMDALHDYHPTDITKGEKKVIVLSN